MNNRPSQDIPGRITSEDLQRIGKLVALGGMDLAAFEIVHPKVTIDSRTCEKDGVFIALKGSKTDGHAYVRQAFEKGVKLCVVEHTWWQEEEQVLRAVNEGDQWILAADDPLDAMQKLATGYRQKFNIPVIAIGGSNGKTTTKEMVAKVLGKVFRVVATKGNYNNHIGVPLTLFQIKNDTEIAVLELGINHPGEMNELCEIAQPTHGLLTNIGLEHTEFLISKDSVAEAEGELFEYLRQHKGELFVNADDVYIARQAKGEGMKSYYGKCSSEHKYSTWLEEVFQNEKGHASLVIRNSKDVVIIQLRIGGLHNVSNALAATCVGENFGVPLEKIGEALHGFQPISGSMRMEQVELNGVQVINDAYNANPDSMLAALDVLEHVKTSGKKIAVLGDMLELGAISIEAHENIGWRILSSGIDMFYAYGPEMKHACNIAKNKCKGAYQDKHRLYEDLSEVLKPGDVLLLKGSRGMKMEEIVESLKNKEQLNH